MNNLDELLCKIETENTEEILGEQDLVKKLNFLCENGLVEIIQEKIALTENGKKARTTGIDSPVPKIRSTDFTTLNAPLEKKGKRASNFISKLKKKLLRQ